MTSLTSFARRLLYLIRRDRFTADLEEEMRLHRDLRAERLQGGGVAPDEARFAAKRRFGNPAAIQERSRDMWGFDGLEQAGADLRFAVRRLRNRPGFSLSVIAVAALGIGATTAVFSAVDAAILRPLPFVRPEELVTLPEVSVPFDEEMTERASGPREVDLLDVLERRDLFANAAAYAVGGLNIDDPVQPRRVNVSAVTAGFFSTLGVVPRAGRTFTADEGVPGGPSVALISDALWQNQFGGREIVGTTLQLSGLRYAIVGVLPPNFGFPSQSDVWIPLSVPTTRRSYAPYPRQVIARRAPGVTQRFASLQLLARWELAIPKPVAGRKYVMEEIVARIRVGGAVLPLQRELVGADRRKALWILMGATVLLLLIAGANVGNLLLSDAATRRREVAVREVLGASRTRIVRQLLTESILLALTGAALGVAVAPVTLGILRALMPVELAGTSAMQLDLRLLWFAALVAVVTGIAFGLWPALGAARIDPAETIKGGGGHGATAGEMGRTRQLLITAELALTVMLLVGSGLMLRSFHRVMNQDFGMNPERVGTLEIAFAPSVNAQGRARVIHAMLDRLAADPAIVATGVVNDLPLRPGSRFGLRIAADGMPTPDGRHFPRYGIASSGYFKALGIPILRGRGFERGDDSVGQHVAIVSKTTAELFWRGADPLGRTFTVGGDTTKHYMVIGIVADVHDNGVIQEPTPQMYFSADEHVPNSIGLVARGTLPPGALLSRLTGAVRFADPSQAVYNVRTMEAVIGQSVAPRRTNTLLIAIFGGLALVLSAFGVYAVVSYGVARRARELGIRVALGATHADLATLVGREMAGILLVGLGLGLGGAWALTRVLSSMLYEVSAHDLATFVVVPLVLLVPAAIATLVPAARAMRVSPTEVMRAE